MNLFDDKAFATASVKSIIGNFGKLVYSNKDLPRHGKAVRVNELGFTLTEQYNDHMPFDHKDIYIGRLAIGNGELAVNDFVLYTMADETDGECLYITSDMVSDYHSDVFGKYYAFVNNYKNYHGMWFRATIDTYKRKHSDWAIDLTQTFNDLKPVFDDHYALARNLGINRFVSELVALEDFYCWAGFINPTDKTRYT